MFQVALSRPSPKIKLGINHLFKTVSRPYTMNRIPELWGVGSRRLIHFGRTRSPTLNITREILTVEGWRRPAGEGGPLGRARGMGKDKGKEVEGLMDGVIR